MEGKFGLTISDEQAARIHTIRQAVDYINREIESRA
jgi:acyl carrier protein